LSVGRHRALADAATIGFAFPACTLAGYFLGRWADGAFGTAPTMSYAGGILGIAAAFATVFRIAARSDGREDSDR
jgi:F0F1-type ATP synthase assembly protein I